MIGLPLIEMYFGKGALTAEQKADLSRKVTDLIVKEANSHSITLG
jgi:phenylpyruvate tautomerase PptA (4-oxalocrotonate tautomerase family)